MANLDLFAPPAPVTDAQRVAAAAAAYAHAETIAASDPERAALLRRRATRWLLGMR